MCLRYLLMGCLFSIIFLRAEAQSIDSYTNRLFFNAFTAAPDTAITGFLRLYIPVLTINRTPGSWVKYPQADTLHAHDEIHSFVFRQHAYFPEKITSGHLDFFCRRYEGPQLIQNITGLQLWFEFSLQQDAEIAFSRLVDMFILVSTEKKINTVNGAVKAAFINRNDKTGFTRVRASMMADNVGTNKYKVLFEAGNDL